MQSAIIILFESKLAPSRPSRSFRNPVKTTFSFRQQQLQLFQVILLTHFWQTFVQTLLRELYWTVSFCSCGRIFPIMLKLISSPGPKFYPLCIYYEGFRLKCVAEHRFCKKRLKNDLMQEASANPWKFNRISECNIVSKETSAAIKTKKTFPLPTTLVPNRETRSWNADILYKMMLKKFPRNLFNAIWCEEDK